MDVSAVIVPMFVLMALAFLAFVLWRKSQQGRSGPVETQTRYDGSTERF